ncbi:BspA family leucine-rich repeat surface protein, partial [Flavobacteriales bacterium]|nr:BspA family leucine-rich repeat surface protein [Flavobacteriales bacterium]
MKFNNETIRPAVKEWVEDAEKAEEKYGHISNWDVSNVTKMDRLFCDPTDPYYPWELEGANLFNEDLSNWDVSNVKNMRYMFAYATSFNQDISKWDVSNVTEMMDMFRDATSFNQDIGGWDV